MLHNIHVSDVWMSRAIHEFAKLGTWGEHTGNINRELKHWLGEPTLPKAMMVTVPTVIPKGPDVNATTKGVQSPILFAHQVVSHVYQHHPAWFNSLNLGEHNVQDTPRKEIYAFFGHGGSQARPKVIGASHDINSKMETHLCALVFAW